jgi:hypothetical protein
MRRRSAKRNESALPPQLLRSAPRDVGLSKAGVAMLLVVGALVVGGCFGALGLYTQAATSERRVALFASDGVSVEAEVTRVQRRGSGEDRRTVVHYRYLVGDRELTGETTVRRQDRDRHSVGSRVEVRYLASEPHSSWMKGYGPRRQPYFPAFGVPVACLLIALGVALLIRRHAELLENGTLAQAVITKVEKKQGQHGTAWRVTYQWRLLSGALRSGGYERSGNEPPSVGSSLPILYDRDEPARQKTYPFGLVKLKSEG